MYETQHNKTCHYAKCRILIIVMLNVAMLSVVMLDVIILSVTGPIKHEEILIFELSDPLSQKRSLR